MIPAWTTRLAIAAAAMVLVAGPAAAKPTSARCVWESVPAAGREKMLADYRLNAMDAKLQKPDEAAIRACGADESSIDATAHLLVAAFFENGSLVVLQETYHLTPQAIAAAFEAIDPQLMVQLRIDVPRVARSEDPDPAAIKAGLAAMARTLHTPEGADEHLFAYLIGRILRETYEA